MILKPQGIKVLSLFFIDKVANYRYYDDKGNSQKGIYAQIFEEEYKNLIIKPKYHTLYKEVDLETLSEGVHNGYFAQDKKGVLKDTSGKTIADDDAYSLIMRDKEKLLSFESKLKFIFSHSALKEGWDNPNVFQICTLNETKSTIKKRQEIGRGLRLCVNQEGERIKGFQTNTLTVMANESYENFAKTLQKEIEEEEGIKFGLIQKHAFANITQENQKGELEYIGSDASEEIFNFFRVKGYVKANGKVTDNLKLALAENNIELPEKFTHLKDAITNTAKKATKELKIRNINDKRKVKLNKKVYLSPEFKEFWDKIKYKTTYAVDFSTPELIRKCVNFMDEHLDVKPPKLIGTKARVDIKDSGVSTTEKERKVVHADDEKVPLPDIITFLQNETYLTRQTIVDILIQSGTLNQFKKNPQQYMDETLKIISSKMKHMLVDGIKYTKIGYNEYYAQELFENTELFGYLSKNMMASERSVYDHIIYDSKNEAEFAARFENNANVILYTKLPGWFKIPTPLGSYNPDWAVLFDQDGNKKLYFILETKGNVQFESLRQTESDKIRCGKKHFESLGEDVKFEVADNYESFIDNIY